MYRWAVLFRLHEEELVCEYKCIGPAPVNATHPDSRSQVWLGCGHRKLASFDYFMASPFNYIHRSKDIN